MILYTSIFQYFTGDLILIKSSFLFSLRNGLKTITNRLVILARLNLASCLKIEAELPHGKIVTDPEHAYNLSFPPTFDVRKNGPMVFLHLFSILHFYGAINDKKHFKGNGQSLVRYSLSRFQAFIILSAED